jgi:hypothetical protein
MRPSNTLELDRLANSDSVIEKLLSGVRSARNEHRFQLLEAAASRIGGFNLEEFHHRFGINAVKPVAGLLDDARCIVQAIDECGIHPALALSALARETLDDAERKSNGAYHTDFRLAFHLAHSVEDRLKPGIKVIDPACGAGILLAAVSVVACGPDRILASDWLRDSVHAADRSPLALRGTLIALAALTDDLDALHSMRSKWRIQDSLMAPEEGWRTIAPGGFDLVIANPPWEKVKLSRHEYLKANGSKRHYGSSYDKKNLTGYETAKSAKARFASKLVEKYPALANGEPDLYVELLLNLTSAGGGGAVLVPAGLIRSLNTKYLRTELIASCKKLTITVMDNRARHFAIDTRFKFLLVDYTKARPAGSACRKIAISHARAVNDALLSSPPVNLPVTTLRKLRPDLTLPEVRTVADWRLFKKMQEKGISPDCPESSWNPAICREVDMTHGRRHFRKSQAPDRVPLIEGRMVQPHRLGCKAYVVGEGRRAVWDNLAPGRSTLRPQFWMPVAALSSQVQGRIERVRAGFCDITGQTNERSMMAALVPPGVVCGNKVPTIEFPNDPSEERILLWLSIVNSLPFDWLLRRVVTTTVNYFVLLSVKLPPLDIESLPARRLVEIARRLSFLDTGGRSSFKECWKIARLRAEADVMVANAYGCTERDLRLMLRDFPLLDRGQPPIFGEGKSTITSDLLMQAWAHRKNKKNGAADKRVADAMERGAVAYISSEFVSSLQDVREIAREQ